jgi:hypothetical protein
MNKNIKAIFSFQALTSRRIFGVFERLGKKLTANTHKSSHRDRMRLLSRHKKTGQNFTIPLEKEPNMQFINPAKYVNLLIFKSKDYV